MAKTPTRIASLARGHTEAAIRVLVEIMENRSAEPSARVAAATQILNRGLGPLVDPVRYAPIVGEFYVYSVHDDDGKMLYIGKGCGRRHMQSAQRVGGRSRIRAEFDDEKAALAFERRLIERFLPPQNTVYARH